MSRYSTRGTAWVRRNARQRIAAWVREGQNISVWQHLVAFRRDYDPDISYEDRLHFDFQIRAMQDRMRLLVTWIRNEMIRVPNWRDR